LQDLSFPHWCCWGFSLLGHHTVVLHEWFLHEMTRGLKPQQIKYPLFMTNFLKLIFISKFKQISFYVAIILLSWLPCSLVISTTISHICMHAPTHIHTHTHTHTHTHIHQAIGLQFMAAVLSRHSFMIRL
jgi:hypothetical protein